MRYVFLLLVCLLLSSCAAVSHLDEALKLKEYSDDKDAQVDYITASNRRFDALLAYVESGGSSREYRSKHDFIARFGNPVLEQTVSIPDGRYEERLLYRYATKYFDGPKVYVFFDETGQFKRFEHDKRQH